MLDSRHIPHLARRGRLAAVLAVGAVALSAGVATGAVDNVVSTVVGTGEQGAPNSNGAATATRLNAPRGVAVRTTDGEILVSDGGSNGRVLGVSGGTLTSRAFPLNDPGGIAVDPTDAATAAVAVTGSGQVRGLASSGTPLMIAGLTSPTDVAYDATGNLYVAERGANKILKLAPGASTPTVLAGTGASTPAADGGVAAGNPISSPTGLSYDASDHSLLVAEQGSSRVLKIDVASQTPTYHVLAGTAAGKADGKIADGTAKLDQPRDIVATGDGRYLIADGGNHAIRMIERGELSTIAGHLGAAGSQNPTSAPKDTYMNTPSQLALRTAGDGSREVLFTDEKNFRVRSFPLPDASAEDPGPGTGDPGTGGPGTGGGSTGGGGSGAGGGSTSGGGSGAGTAYPSRGADIEPARDVPRKALLASDLPAPASPVVAKRVLVQPAGGTTRVQLPGTRRYVDLDGRASIPVGSKVDVTRGRVRLTSASNRAGGRQTAIFSQGVFKLRQKKARRPVTELVLVGRISCPRSKAAASIAKRRRHKTRKLWGRGHGRFRTRGRRSAATVTGTIWGVYDRCDGTLTRVRRGSVKVRDFKRNRTVTVTRGKQYLARR